MKYIILLSIVALSACAQKPESHRDGFILHVPTIDPNQPILPAVVRPEPRPAPPVAKPAEIQKVVAQDKKVEEVAKKNDALGTTVASLGSPAEQGLWLKTPLVSKTQQGTVTAANGKVVELKLIPLDGPESAGSRMSLQAFLALGLQLTDLPKLAVNTL